MTADRPKDDADERVVRAWSRAQAKRSAPVDLTPSMEFCAECTRRYRWHTDTVAAISHPPGPHVVTEPPNQAGGANQ